jgi:hypothetical protein
MWIFSKVRVVVWQYLAKKVLFFLRLCFDHISSIVAVKEELQGMKDRGAIV